MPLATFVRDLTRRKLAGRTIDVVGFIDELLGGAAGEIQCRLASERALQFALPDAETCEVELDSCRGKLRMLCARLGVLCNETSGVAISLYGGEGIISRPATNGAAPRQWTVRFRNTPDAHEFAIVPVNVENPNIGAKQTT